jgi:hypothetical protein
MSSLVPPYVRRSVILKTDRRRVAIHPRVRATSRARAQVAARARPSGREWPLRLRQQPILCFAISSENATWSQLPKPRTRCEFLTDALSSQSARKVEGAVESAAEERCEGLPARVRTAGGGNVSWPSLARPFTSAFVTHWCQPLRSGSLSR